MDELREATGVFRTTLRLDTPGDTFPVVAESLGPGAMSIQGPAPFDLRQTATFQFLEREQRILVQDDCTEDPAPPRELIEHYGVGSQMLAPLLRDGRLVGIISVHHAAEPRKWGAEEVAALERAAERVQRELARSTGT